MDNERLQLYRRNKVALIIDAVLDVDAKIRAVASLPGVPVLAKAVFLQFSLRKMVLDITAIKARTWPMEQLHGRRIGVVEVLGEWLTTEQAELLVCAEIGLDATVAIVDATRVGDESCTRIYVEHPRFAVLCYGDDAPLKRRMRRQFRKGVDSDRFKGYDAGHIVNVLEHEARDDDGE